MCVCTIHACAFQRYICVHVWNWHKHRYTWEQCADYINAIWGECLGSTAQHILCVSRPGEIRFMEGCGTTRWGPEQWLFVCCCFIGGDNCSPSPLGCLQIGKQACRHTHAHTYIPTGMHPHSCRHVRIHTQMQTHASQFDENFHMCSSRELEIETNCDIICEERTWS